MNTLVHIVRTKRKCKPDSLIFTIRRYKSLIYIYINRLEHTITLKNKNEKYVYFI